MRAAINVAVSFTLIDINMITSCTFIYLARAFMTRYGLRMFGHTRMPIGAAVVNRISFTHIIMQIIPGFAGAHIA